MMSSWGCFALGLIPAGDLWAFGLEGYFLPILEKETIEEQLRCFPVIMR